MDEIGSHVICLNLNQSFKLRKKSKVREISESDYLFFIPLLRGGERIVLRVEPENRFLGNIHRLKYIYIYI